MLSAKNLKMHSDTKKSNKNKIYINNKYTTNKQTPPSNIHTFNNNKKIK